jgi:hypothetical protein
VPRPFFTLAIVYVFGFWFLYLFAFAAPTLWEIQNAMPDGPEKQRAAEEATRAVLEGRVLPALLLSLATVVLAAWAKKLPGFRT